VSAASTNVTISYFFTRLSIF